jgi:non-ribosomal peptide synthetase component F
VTADIAAAGPIPLGQPLAFDQVFVVDEALRPLPPGSEGQIAVAGPGVALGYHDRPELTARAFIPDPRPGKSGTVYLTGDLGVERDDGSFAFKGRRIGRSS